MAAEIESLSKIGVNNLSTVSEKSIETIGSVRKFLEEYSAFRVSNLEDHLRSGKILNNCKFFKDQLNAEKQNFLKPAKEIVKIAKVVYDPYINKLGDFEKGVKKDIVEFDKDHRQKMIEENLKNEVKIKEEKEKEIQEKEKEIRDEEDKIKEIQEKKKEAIEKGNQQEIENLQNEADKHIKRASNLSVNKEIIKAKVVDVEPIESRIPIKNIVFKAIYRFKIEDESQIPREWMKPDEAKIGNIVRGSKGQIKIPGVKIWEEDIVYARR